MGFRLNMGATMSCRFHDSYLEVDWPSKRKFRTDLPSDLNTDWQCNVFESPVVYFVLSDGKDMYIGISDGSIVVCGYDGLLKKIYTWEAPGEMYGSVVGYYHAERGDVYEAVILLEEPRVVMLKDARRSFILNPGLDALTIDSHEYSYMNKLAVGLSDALSSSTSKLGLTLKGGEPFDEEKHGHWEIDPYNAVRDAVQF